MAATKTIVLITGANSGIGFELAAQLTAKGSYHVLMGVRSIQKGHAALARLQSCNLPGTPELLHLDVTDDETIQRAVETVEQNHGRVDILINNAAIVASAPTLRQGLQEEFNTNATGPAVVTESFIPLLQKSTGSSRIINISSGAGSIARRLDPTSVLYKVPGLQYRVSKAALHMITACQWVEYGPAVKVFAYDPGFTQSNLSERNTAENGAKPAAEAVRPLIDVLEGKRDEEVGQLLHNTGVYPW
ncbi:NAD(P)-binding protein [Aspergillus novofumigatus IBT 16806]|uniref:NAD(P)-binding protein n=1 Tax=Aspergillus novofumigatus (strain IBT 16806) TaxID=1392255 RepID=A0A2I1CEX0_ASPN1|nr:NAD(P)-binding protein [Aspergillus novofumigatus IBT 16806]PKX96183.1 NAD(P)-binding protein [Aspergillus novofumigatus IBT 16806]